MPRAGRRALLGAWLGFYVDMFDVYLPIIALAPASAYFQATGVSAATAAVISAMIFTAALIGRPVGSFLFGHLGDRIGRRRTAIIAVTGFGVTTLIIALLPGYHTWGLASVVALIALRFIDGVFLGGEYTAASPLALEYSPKHRRGLYGAFIMTGYPLAYCSIALITYGMLAIAPAGALNSPYVQWGWRIPFLIGAVLAFVFVGIYVKFVDESVAWQQGPKSKFPLAELFRGSNMRTLLQVFALMTGIWLSLNMVAAVLPSLLKNPVGLNDSQISSLVVIVYAVVAVGYLGAGVLSQRFGRRKFFVINGIVIGVLAPIGFGILVNTSKANLAGVVLLTLLLGLLVTCVWGVVTTYINERFHVGIRASGYGVGYSLAVVIPSFYAFFQEGLSAVMPSKYTPIVLLAVSGVLIVVGALLGPETRDVDMAAKQPAVQ